MKLEAGGQFYKLVVVAWLTFSVGSVVLALLFWHQLSQQLATAKQTLSVRDGLEQIRDSLLQTEMQERGYVITGDKACLARFSLAETNLTRQLNQLVELIHDDGPSLQTVTQLGMQIQTGLGLEHDILTLRDKSSDKAVALVSAGKAETTVDNAVAQIGELEQVYAARLISIRSDVWERVGRANLTSLVAGGFALGAGLLALWLSYVALRHQQHERELIEAKMLAEHSNREKTLFLANMSHEIRTPMNAILGFSELLQGDLREPKHRQYLQAIRANADSLLLLINDILDMSKIEAGVMQLHPEPTDLREICDFVHALFSEPAAKKGIRLKCGVADNLPHALLLDRIRLRQVLINLVGNAVKFTDQGGVEVRVAWEKQQTRSHVTLVVEVQDTGLGIPQDKLDAIFQPFVQAGSHREKEKQGTGLGLAIVKRLVEIMGGSVTVASVMDQGSAFQLRFPNVPVSARLPASEKQPSTGEVNFNDLRPSNLLAVDDNETNCQLLAAMFAGSHHRLHFGANGAEAILRARELMPDVMLLDVRMPGMNGDEALTEIRKIPGLEFLPVIAVTASSLSDEENSLKESFSGFIRKPFSKRELFDELADFLPRHQRSETTQSNGETRPATPSPAVPTPAELISQLRQLMADPWPSIRDSVAVNESKVFAEGLEGLGRRWQCEPLVLYAQKILRAAENYAVTDLENHLAEFSNFVAQLERNSSA